MDHEPIIALARTQHGLVTKRQALALGATDQRIRTLLAAGTWQRARRSVFVVGAAADTWERRVMAACLAGGLGVVASHRTAARLSGLVDRSGPIQVLASDDARHQLAGVEVHRTAFLPADDRTVIADIPATTLARTIVDLAGTQPVTTIGRWVDHGLRTGELDILELRCCVARLAGPGRTRLDGLETVLAERLPGYDPGESELERRALAILRAAGLPDPVTQHPVLRPGGRMAFIDLAYPDERVGIELDGWEFHGQRGEFDRDRSRRNDLTLLGWSMFHFTSTTPPDLLVSTVRRALEGAATTVDPAARTGRWVD